jgi:peptidylprolyl isomerase
MKHADKGSTVRIHYRATFDDGTLFDTSDGSNTLEFTIGETRPIPDIEGLVTGMFPGERRVGRIPAEEAYREHMGFQPHPKEGQRKWMPDEGQEVFLCLSDGQVVPSEVKKGPDGSFKLDVSPALAGKDLTFEIHLLEIVRDPAP